MEAALFIPLVWIAWNIGVLVEHIIKRDKFDRPEWGESDDQ